MEKTDALAPASPQPHDIVDAQTGEVLGDFVGYAGVATVDIGQDKADKLTATLPDEAHDILPTGEVYVGQVHYRRLLNEVFGPGGWALVPRGPYTKQGNTICREYALVGPGGRFISEAIGEADYQPNNARMSYASACEACKSNGLTRCCKDIGIASECWDRRWCEAFKAKHCVQVWRKGQRTPQWRRKDAQPWHDETGIVGEKEAQAAAPSEAASVDECPHCHESGHIATAKDGRAFCKACGRGV